MLSASSSGLGELVWDRDSVPMNPPSESKVIAITGAAHGIASTAARRFCVEGARVGLIDIDGVALDGLSRELGESALGVTADVTESHELEQAF